MTVMKKLRALRMTMLMTIAVASVLPSTYNFYFCNEMQEAMPSPCCDHTDAESQDDASWIDGEACCSLHSVTVAHEPAAPTEARAPLVALAATQAPPLSLPPLVASVRPVTTRLVHDPAIPIFLRDCTFLI